MSPSWVEPRSFLAALSCNALEGETRPWSACGPRDDGSDRVDPGPFIDRWRISTPGTTRLASVDDMS